MPENFHTEHLPGGISFDMIWVEGGTIEMSSNYKATLDDFYIGKFPVTQAVWKALTGYNPSFFKGDQRPVESVSWTDALNFIKALNENTLGTRPQGHAYRLPTEAEWEFAARGGKKSRGYEYAGSNLLHEVGWYDENSHNETKAVGQKRPNELGLYDMSGNVWEWCLDWYGGNPKGEFSNPKGPDKGIFRMSRGGSWYGDALRCRASNRRSNASARRHNDLGFRLVLSPLSVG